MPRGFTRRMAHEAPVQVSDGAGGFVRSWEDRGALWCEMRMRSGQLKATEFGETPRLAVRIVTHCVPAGEMGRPAPGHRLTDAGGRRFVVDAVHDGEAGRHLMTILAREEAAA